MVRSATIHAVAEMSDGTGGAPSGSTKSQLPSAGPPTGSAGTGSGAGAATPGGSASEVSTAGGGLWRCGQPVVSGGATVSEGGR